MVPMCCMHQLMLTEALPFPLLSILALNKFVQSCGGFSFLPLIVHQTVGITQEHMVCCHCLFGSVSTSRFTSCI